MYRVVKTYGHERGLSCCFRQWKADSHCSKLHGYALAFTIIFEADDLDARNWVLDFGGLKEVKAWLEEMFDHTMAISADDPEWEILHRLHGKGMADIRTFAEGVGCERFAQTTAMFIDAWIKRKGFAKVRLHSVECREHSGNAAAYLMEGSV